MWFEPNQGQANPEVRFLARSSGMNVFLTDRGVFAVISRDEDSNDLLAPRAGRPELRSHTVELKLIGANAGGVFQGIEKLTGTSNYFIGNLPAKWRTNVPNYARVERAGVYPGVNMVFYGNERRLQYDFVVQPGGDPSAIQLAYAGVDSIAIDPSGDLLMRTDLGVITQHKPLVYQDLNGKRVEVAARYVLRTDTRVSIALANYDRRQALVIDPILSYSTHLGGGGASTATGVAVDKAGAVYVTGKTLSTDFPVHSAYRVGASGGSDVFIAKLNPDGASLAYSTYIGGDADDAATGIAVDATGAAFVTGYTESSTFPTLGGYSAAFGGGSDAFALKLAPTGDSLIYSTFLGGRGRDFANGIAIDASGAAYVAGGAGSSDFPLQSALFSGFSATAGVHAFVTKLAPSGGSLVYSTFLGGSGSDQANGIALDASGSAYVTGFTSSADFPTRSAFQSTLSRGASSGSALDAFVTKLAPAGDALVYSTFLGGAGSDRGMGIAIDSLGSAYVTGVTDSMDFPLQAAYAPRIGAGFDAFVTKLSPTGDGLLYSTYLGGSGADYGLAIGVDAAGSAYISGTTDSQDLPILSGFKSALSSGGDGFLAKFSPQGAALSYSTFLGGGRGLALAVGADGVYVAGSASSRSLETSSIHSRGLNQASDAFLAKLVEDPESGAVNTDSSAPGVTERGMTTSSRKGAALASAAATAPAATGVIATPNPVNFNLPFGSGVGSQDVTVTFNGSPDAVTTLSISPQAWLRVIFTSTPNIVRVIVNPSGLAVGTYTGSATAYTADGSVTFPVNFTVSANMTVSPASGSNTSQTFTFTFNDPSGWQSLSVADILINNFLDGRQACYVAFVPSGASAGSVYLVNDAGNAGGPYSGMVLPGSGTVQNSQCTINGANSSVSNNGNTLTLTLAMTFSGTFSGNKIIYMSEQDTTPNNSGWQTMGTWGVPGGSITGPAVSGVSPAQSSSSTQTFTFTITDTNGWQDLTVLNVLINNGLDGRHACYIAFAPSSSSGGALYLVDDAGEAGGPYAGMTLPGTSTVQNSQCAIGGSGSSVSGSGNTLTVTLSMGFGTNLAGNRVIYMAARSATLNSGWQAVGTIAVP